jgi:hypothetical protein
LHPVIAEEQRQHAPVAAVEAAVPPRESTPPIGVYRLRSVLHGFLELARRDTVFSGSIQSPFVEGC